MQNKIFQTLLLLFPLSLTAQDCATVYDYFKEGATLEYTNYDKKGKMQSVNTQRVASIEEKADTTIATLEMTSIDNKSKELFSTTFPMKCHQGVIYMDMRSLISQATNGSQSPDMKIEVTGTDMAYPPNMKPGQTLPDSEMEMKMQMGGIQIMNSKYHITNRKVEAEETITTAAGTYKCLKISHDTEYKLMGTRTQHSELWYSTSVGMVKSVTYDQKGREASRTELTRFTP